MDQQSHALFDEVFRRRFEDLIRWRRDVRRFQPMPVPQDLIEHCIKVANLSPSVGLSQPWRFVELVSQAPRDAVIASFEACNAEALETYGGSTRQHYAGLKLEGLREAPVQLAVFVDETTTKGKNLGRLTMPEMLRYSVVTAVHTFWLAAHANGLGVGWVSIVDPQDVARACQVPNNWSLVAYLCIGWPEQPSLKPELERAGWEERALDPMLFHRI